MESNFFNPEWQALSSALKGTLHTDTATRTLYATDASVYRVLPDAVAMPKDADDIRLIIQFAQRHNLPLIPRTAGTSLAGQVVGKGLVIDMSMHFTEILECNTDHGWVRLQPGVIRDELNRFLEPLGLFFGPNTSSASRCMIGGMVGNNSSGTTSIKYGVTRDKILEAEVILSDGSTAVFGIKSADEIAEITSRDTLEGSIYRQIVALLSDTTLQKEIRDQYPDASIHRRNTGYALDIILQQSPFTKSGESLNLAKLLAGSEGTLCVVTALKMALDKLPPKYEAVICAHFESLHESLLATVIAMEHSPYACELMDKAILDCTKGNIEQAENRFFVEGDPAAIISIELRGETREALDAAISKLLLAFRESGYGYAFPVMYPPETAKVWNLRAAGLGVLSNVKGAAKPVPFVEDTAVNVKDLPEYIEQFEALMAKHKQKAVYFAHAGAGELHIRPVLNLKSKQGRADFRSIAEDSARLVKQYRGALSGEHGDGRVRAEFIPIALGPIVYQALVEVKNTWDPSGIFNPGKIVNASPMDTDLRYTEGQTAFKFPTFIDFSEQVNLQEAAEACNGSGDCRKLHTTGATMCPSYQATRREHDSTRARANTLREVLTNPSNPVYPLDSEPLKEVMDLCLSCKACKRECPSSVDMALMKAEVSWQYGRRHGFTTRAKFFGAFHRSARLASAFAPLVNSILSVPAISTFVKTKYQIAPKRSLPPFAVRRATELAKKYVTMNPEFVLYIDEFTQYQDSRIAEAVAKLMHALGYRFATVYAPSARAYISKGMLHDARITAHHTLKKLEAFMDNAIPVVGIEPSAVLGFRDEFPKIVGMEYKPLAEKLAKVSCTFEEYFAGEVAKGRIGSDRFDAESREVHLHLHCHQKALSHVKYTKAILSLPQNTKLKVIPSGCCGMAGSFGYEAEHYELSMKIGEMVLFPHIRKTIAEAVIIAAGTSCRHQISDGTSRKAVHPAELLLDCLKK